MHRHLQRLHLVWEKQPVYFVTTCVTARRSLLSTSEVAGILREEWEHLRGRHGWAVGRYVIMPDHVHFFIAPESTSAKPLAMAVGKWKEWTAKRILKKLRLPPPLWQPEFFDHLLRSRESRSEKWEYVRQNPVRAGLVRMPEEWSFAGFVDFE
ncbi:REP-associated tyrosine transposase [Opitutus terrae]|uniref:REP-associated tyrosine transposase n=1 Tax=Opitutus terrae TaxID=107709 RepID=UPI003CCCBBA5